MANILVNLPSGFFTNPRSSRILDRLEGLGNVRRTSHNSPQQISADLAWADAVLMWSWPELTDDLLDSAPRLQMLAHLDLTQRAAQTALARGLPVSQGRGAFSPAVAEMALTLLLTCLRRTSTFHRQMAEGTEPWVGSFPDEVDPLERELTGLHVGIVGFGRIGQRLAELLGPFHCPLSVIDPFVDEAQILRFPNARRTSLREALPKLDALVLCAASNDGTQKLLGPHEIEQLPANSVLVNVARAALVDSEALLARLERRDLFAALDVFDQEPLPSDHPLRSLPNAYLTPHRAGGIWSSVGRILKGLIDDLERHFAGKELANPLTEGMIPALDK